MSVVHVGLCASCVHHRIIENRRGSRFHLCELARTDARFSKYPPLPVLRCPGYDPVDVHDPERSTGAQTAGDEHAGAGRASGPREGDGSGPPDGDGSGPPDGDAAGP